MKISELWTGKSETGISIPSSKSKPTAFQAVSFPANRAAEREVDKRIPDAVRLRMSRLGAVAEKPMPRYENASTNSRNADG
jgi:hypothetical protein